MRLLFVHERFGAFGGAESNLRITAEELAARGHQVALLHGPSTRKDEKKWMKAFGGNLWPIEQARPAVAVLGAINSFKPDLVYVHKMADLNIIKTLLEASRPLVRMVHDHDIYCMKSYKYAYLSRRICSRPASPYCLFPCAGFIARNREGSWPVRWVSYRAKLQEIKLNQEFDRMIVVSEYMRQELLRNGFNPERIEIHPPVPRMGDEALRSSFSERNLILYAGQLIRGKGVDVLLRALSGITLPFQCVILGEGNHRATCEKLSRKLGLADRVSFKGFVPQEELKSYYGECTVVAVSSVWPEPIATIGLEAMRHALPVVAFDAGGIKDWLLDGYNGYLIPWMNHKQYGERLEELLANKPLARQMGLNGLKLASERFDFESYISGLVQTFQRVLEQHAQRRSQSA